MTRQALLWAMVWMGQVWPAGAAEAVLQPGEKAPPIELADVAGARRRLDATTTGTTLLVFVKPGDRYTTAALAALDHMAAQVPAIAAMRRWIVVSRLDTPAQARATAAGAGPGWIVLPDPQDRAYRDYRIIATPTLVAVTSGTVVAVHAGYDPAMEDSVRRKLAEALGIQLPAAMVGEPERPNMTLQMGRRMAARGLWDRALEFYRQLEAQGELVGPARVEMAQVLIEIGRLDEAIERLEAIPADAPEAEAAARALDRARALKAGRPAPTPPRVTR